MHSEDKVKNTSQTLKNLYEKLRSPILMLIDEEPSFKTISRLTSCIQANGTPIDKLRDVILVNWNRL